MTALNFAITDDGVFLATDSLVTHEGEPLRFTTKVLTVPHLDGLICATGSIVLFHRWALEILSQTSSGQMSYLDPDTPEALRSIWAGMSEEERGGTGTIYHFGYDRDEDRFEGFGYRSWNNFESEPLTNCIDIKPPFAGPFSTTGFPDDFVETWRGQKVEQDKLPAEKRVHIGGHIFAYTLQRRKREGQPTTTFTTVETAFVFEDLDDMYWRAMMRNVEDE